MSVQIDTALSALPRAYEYSEWSVKKESNKSFVSVLKSPRIAVYRSPVDAYMTCP